LAGCRGHVVGETLKFGLGFGLVESVNAEGRLSDVVETEVGGVDGGGYGEIFVDVFDFEFLHVL
jgi:hypothetical protein